MNHLIFLIMMILSSKCISLRYQNLSIRNNTHMPPLEILYVRIHILLLATLKYFWDIATLSITGKKSNFWSHVIYHPKVLNKTFILGSYPPTMFAVCSKSNGLFRHVVFACYKHTNLYQAVVNFFDVYSYI